MLDQGFAASVIHAHAPASARLRGFSGYVVLGQRLRPFTYWHAFGLDLIESPFFGAKGPFTFANLYIATQVCRSRYPHPIEYRSIFAKLKLAVATFRLGARFEKDTEFFISQINAFSLYLRDYTSSPVVAQSAYGGTTSKCPWYSSSVMQLMELGLSKAEAWNTTIGEGTWLNTAAMERTIQEGGGSIDIETPELTAAFARAGRGKAKT